MKKFLALLLAAVMTISMAACGNTQETTDTAAMQNGDVVIPIDTNAAADYKIVVEEIIITESVAWEKPQYVIEAKVRNLSDEVCDNVSIQAYLYDDEDTSVSGYYFSVLDLAPGKAAKVEIFSIDAYNNTDVDISKGFSVSFNNYTIFEKIDNSSTYAESFSEAYEPFLSAQYPEKAN